MAGMFTPLRRYADFEGRSRRQEYWLWVLFNCIVVGALVAWLVVTIFMGVADVGERAAGGEFDNYVPDAGTHSTVTYGGVTYQVPPEVVARAMAGAFLPGGLLAIWYLATFIPNLAVIVRRLHDQDKSGWFVLFAFLPILNLVLLVFMFLDGTSGPNRYGPDPKGRPARPGYA